MNRRQALALLAAMALGARLRAQTRATAQHKVFLGGGTGLLLAPDGTLQGWRHFYANREPAPPMLGLGDERPVDAYTLYPLPALRGIVVAALGSGAAFALQKDGRLLAWGDAGSGEFGITPRAEFEERAQARMRTSTPTPLAVPFDAVDVSCKDDHVLALARDGSVWSWGRGDSGQLGIGPLPTVTYKTRSARVEPYVPYPVRIPDFGGVRAIAAGNDHSLALLEDGTVRAWGQNRYGQIGDGASTNRERPTVVPGVRDAVAISAGSYRSVALRADGTVLEWGANHENLTPRRTPMPVAGARGIKSIVAGQEQVVAITQTGDVLTWGQNSHYDIGRAGDPHTAGPVKGVADVRWIASARGSTIAILGSGRMLTWGEVRPWTRPDPGQPDLSPQPILLWLDGLEQP